MLLLRRLAEQVTFSNVKLCLIAKTVNSANFPLKAVLLDQLLATIVHIIIVFLQVTRRRLQW